MIIKGEFQSTGVNGIDTDLAVENWNHLWCLTEWRRDNTWRVIKFLRKDSPVVEVKTTISCVQAHELVKRLDLKPVGSCFSSGYSWVKTNDIAI